MSDRQNCHRTETIDNQRGRALSRANRTWLGEAMIDHTQLRELVIMPALKGVNLYSPEAEEVLIAIAAQEGNDGYYLKQTIDNDSALGIFQMRPETHEYLWDTVFLADHHLGFKAITSLNYTLRPSAEVMVYNLRYAAVMARIFWLRIKEPFPAIDDLEGIWNLYKRHWTTLSGKATKQEFMANYKRYVKGDI